MKTLTIAVRRSVRHLRNLFSKISYCSRLHRFHKVCCKLRIGRSSRRKSDNFICWFCKFKCTIYTKVVWFARIFICSLKNFR
uniref:Uncharacterized protein n=1 Tax=Physcomitrium patens TaxID=3218 RepID=A0A7I4FKZ8_PHYPA